MYLYHNEWQTTRTVAEILPTPKISLLIKFWVDLSELSKFHNKHPQQTTKTITKRSTLYWCAKVNNDCGQQSYGTSIL